MNHITYKPKSQPNARMILDMGHLNWRCERKLLCMGGQQRVDWIRSKFPSLIDGEIKELDLDTRLAN